MNYVMAACAYLIGVMCGLLIAGLTLYLDRNHR